MDDDPHRSPARRIRLARGLMGTAAAGALTLGLVGWTPTGAQAAPVLVDPQSQTDETTTDAVERLGADSDDGEGGARITSVRPGSAAAGAGLRIGELITAIDGTAVRSTKDLLAALARLASGDWVTVATVGLDGLSRATVLSLD